MNEHMGSTHVQKYYCKHCVNHLWIKIVLKQHRVLLNDENNTRVVTMKHFFQKPQVSDP